MEIHLAPFNFPFIPAGGNVYEKGRNDRVIEPEDYICGIPIVLPRGTTTKSGPHPALSAPSELNCTYMLIPMRTRTNANDSVFPTRNCFYVAIFACVLKFEDHSTYVTYGEPLASARFFAFLRLKLGLGWLVVDGRGRKRSFHSEPQQKVGREFGGRQLSLWFLRRSQWRLPARSTTARPLPIDALA
jgi:hypothetical protein